MSNIITNQLGAVSSVVTIPNDVELVLPFGYDSSGGTAVLVDKTQRAVQHLIMLAFTMPTERVMRPGYGVGVQALVFSNVDINSMQLAAQALQDMYASTEGGAATVQVSAVQSSSDPGTYMFSAAFTIDQSPVVHTAVFDYAGNLVGTE